MDISIQLSQKDGADIVRYIGPINEEAEVHLAQLAPKLGKKCIINLSQVAYVNSCGVRSWINFMREVDKNRDIVFEECTSEIVMQINMIPSFQGKAKVLSVFASYCCDKCSHRENVLFESGKNMPTSSDFELPEQKCKKCGSPMEMEELEDEFFGFLSVA